MRTLVFTFALLLLAACGRDGFDPADAGGSPLDRIGEGVGQVGLEPDAELRADAGDGDGDDAARAADADVAEPAQDAAVEPGGDAGELEVDGGVDASAADAAAGGELTHEMFVGEWDLFYGDVVACDSRPSAASASNSSTLVLQVAPAFVVTFSEAYPTTTGVFEGDDFVLYIDDSFFETQYRLWQETADLLAGIRELRPLFGDDMSPHCLSFSAARRP